MPRLGRFRHPQFYTGSIKLKVLNSNAKPALLAIVIVIALSYGLAAALFAFDRPGSGSPRKMVSPRANTSATLDKVAVAASVRKNVIERFKDLAEGAEAETPDFQRHVAPLLGRLGCNGRSCHGSFQGQGGFQLSLFGYDFQADHKALLTNGRVDVESPEQSLILTKPTDEDNHEGGLRYEKGSWQFNLLSSWVKSGATAPESIHKLDRLVVEPAELRLLDPSETVELRALAHWVDGTVEDVTPLCRFHSNNDSIALITEQGSVSTDDVPGDTHVVVSYDSAVVAVPVIHPVGNHSANLGSEIKTPTPIDKLVASKWEKLGILPSPLSSDAMFLRRVSIDITGTLPTSKEIRDFLADTDPDKRSKKIDSLLDSPAYAAWWTTFFCDMTENNTFQLRNISYNDNSASNHWYNWIHHRVEQNVPYDEMIAGIVTGISRKPDESYLDYCQRMSGLYGEGADGSQSESMPYYWMRREFQDRDSRAISFAHAFLGLRIQCAQCHKHPFDRWSQDDFVEFSKFFGGVSMKNYNGNGNAQDKKDYKKILSDLGIDPENKNNGEIRKLLAQAMKKGETTPFGFLSVHAPKPSKEELKAYAEKMKEQKLERKKRKKNKDKNTKLEPLPKLEKPTVKSARLLGDQTVDLTKHGDIRVPVMDWMRRPDNPFFAKALVNRVWARYFGVGIVDPADDLNLANPPSNGPLLDHLAAEFVKQDFDLKWLHRQVANSRTYQLSWVPNETNINDRRNFSKALPRRLPAEVIFDAVVFAASNPKINSEFRDTVEGRAISIPGTKSKYGGKRKKGVADSGFALKVFGKSERASSCDCDRSEETSLIQTVYMQNDRDIHSMLRQKNSWLHQLAGKHQDTQAAESEKRQLEKSEKRHQGLMQQETRIKKSGKEKQLLKIQIQIDKSNQRLDELRAKIAEAESQKEDLDLQEIITEAYLRTLSRLPSAEELARCEGYIGDDKDLINGVTGVMWALVNTKEFIVNH